MQRRLPLIAEQKSPDPLEAVADVALEEAFRSYELVAIEGIKQFMPHIQEAPGTKKWLSYEEQNLPLPPNQAQFIKFLRDKLSNETDRKRQEKVANLKILLDSYWPKYSDNHDATGVMTCPIILEPLTPPPTALAITLESGRRFNTVALIKTQQSSRPAGSEPFEAKYNFSRRDWDTVIQAARDPAVRKQLKQEELPFIELRSSWFKSIWERKAARYLFNVFIGLCIMAVLMGGIGSIFSSTTSLECIQWGTLVGGVGTGLLLAYTMEFFGPPHPHVDIGFPYPPRKEVQIGQDQIGWLELSWDAARFRDILRSCYESKMRERSAFNSTGYRVARELNFQPGLVHRRADLRESNQAHAPTDELKHVAPMRPVLQAQGPRIPDSERNEANYRYGRFG